MVSYALFDHREHISLSVTANKKIWCPYEYTLPPSAPRTTLYANKKLYVIRNSHTGAYSTMQHNGWDFMSINIKSVHVLWVVYLHPLVTILAVRKRLST